MIRIKSKRDGFRRAGRAHPAAWTEHPDRAFTKKQLARLKAEPMLMVEVVRDKTPDKKGKTTDKKA